MAVRVGIRSGQAVHMALTQAGLTVRRPAYSIICGNILSVAIAVYVGLVFLGYGANLAVLVSGLTTLSVGAGGVAWHQRHRRAR